MSGFHYPQPTFFSSCYNPAFYLSLDQTGYLTYAYAQTLYLGINDYRLSYITEITPGTATPGIALITASDGSLSGLGALSCSSLTVGGSAVQALPSYVVGIIPGTAAASLALVLDSSSNITGINSLSATSLSGTIQTASQPNITSVANLNITAHDGVSHGLSLGGTLITASGSEINYIDVVVGSATANKALVLDGSLNITGINSLSATNLTGTLQTAAQPNITSLGTLTSLIATNITGTLQTAAQPNITSTGSLSITPTATRTIATGITSVNCLWYSASNRYFGMRQPDSNTFVLLAASGGGVYGDNITWNHSTTTLSIAGPISATNLTGTLQTAAQPNITSLGTISSLSAGTINATTYQQGGTTYNLSSFLTAIPSTLSLTSCTATTLSCTTLNQGGVSYALSNFLTTGGSPTFSNITCTTLTCTTNTYRTDLRLSPISGVYGFRVYDTQTSNYPAMSFYTANRSSGILTEFRTYFNDLGSQLIYGSPLQISFQEGSGINSGFFINTQNVGAQTTTNSNVSLGSGQYPQLLTADGQFGRVMIQANDLVNTNYSVQCIIGNDSGNALWVRGRTTMLNSGGAIGDGLLNLLDGTAGSTQVMMRIGNGLSANNCMTLTWKPTASGSSSNYLSFDPYGTSNALTINCNGRVGIGTAAMVAPLHVATSNNYQIGAGGTATAYLYNVAGGTYSNLGLGPYTAGIAAYFSSAILVKTGVYAESDRRLKTDINSIDITLDHFDQLRPVSYRYKSEENTYKLGLIAQEAMVVAKELVNCFPNENLTVEDPSVDIEGMQFTLDYGFLSSLNAAAIKLLIAKVKDLEAQLAKLSNP